MERCNVIIEYPPLFKAELCTHLTQRQCKYRFENYFFEPQNVEQGISNYEVSFSGSERAPSSHYYRGETLLPLERCASPIGILHDIN